MKLQRSWSVKMPAIICNASFGTSKKAEFNSKCICFDEFPERRFELAAKLQTERFAIRRVLVRSWISLS
jgi:hypothetical protein